MFSLINELTNPHCGKLIAMFITMSNPFIAGRVHQLLMDKSKSEQGIDRKSKMLCYIDKLTTLEKFQEAIMITRGDIQAPTANSSKKMIRRYNQHLIKKRTSNGWDILFNITDRSSFDEGRSFQFLLDTDFKAYNTNKLLDPKFNIIEEAHERMEMIIIPKEGAILDHNQCSDCTTWVMGERRCSCGNRRITYEINIDLDSVERHGFCVAW